MAFDRDTLRQLWPHAPQTLVDGVIAAAPAALANHRINTPLRLAHFLAQISHESGGGTITRESLNYTHAARIHEVWPKRFPTVASAEPYVRDPEKLANKVYQRRMGNTQPGDGWRFSGRGLLQITGRDSYREIGTLTGLDLINDPDLAFAPAHSLEVAAAEFAHLGCLPFCDNDDLHAVTERVNGGQEGAADRAAWLKCWRPLVAHQTFPLGPASTAKPPNPASPKPRSGWLGGAVAAVRGMLSLRG
jgi:putative chitinase